MRELIERRLAGTRPPSDPTDVRVPGMGGDIPPALRRVIPRTLTPAAVLVGLVERLEGLQVVLTRRGDTLRDHAGQVSFPGGRIDATDEGPLGAALREAEEEIGLDREFVEPVGYLPNYLTVTGFSVTPVVGFLREGFTLTPEPGEVAEIFEAPLELFMDRARRRARIRKVFGVSVPVYHFEHAGQNIWGATAGMLVNFCEILAEKN